MGQNTEKSRGDLKRLAVTQTPVKDHQLTLMGKTLNNNNNNKGETRMGRQGDPLRNVQEILIRPYKQMVYAQPSTCPRKWHT